MAPSTTARYTIWVQNDGNTPRTFLLRAEESAEAGWTVVYKWGSANITGEARGAAGYTTPSYLPFTGYGVFTIEMTPGATVRAGTRKSVTLKVLLDPAATVARDSVRAIANRAAP